ncbi:MAG: neutral zinc metallopeptidase, partial [Muribaculaceae bacterium]|nr:neutral zinc metallopeptidase [Muribaculaceae bacterium]
MRMNGRRQSGNIDDRRGLSRGGKMGIGGGIVGIIIVAAVTLFSGGGIGDVLSNIMGSGALQPQYAASEYTPTEEDERLAVFASQVLAGTEDVWTREFKRQGWGEYQCPRLVLFSGAVNSGCGQATAQTGPFYCPADQTVYIDLDFFKEMPTSIGAGGDFAYAYVIAHEVGHHVQYLLGTLGQAHDRMSQVSEKESNRLSVRLELQADFYAGVWAALDIEMFSS